MTCPPPEANRNAAHLTGGTRDAILAELVERKSWVQLATPYFAVEARFLEMRNDRLHLRVYLSREALQHAVGKHALRLRFPWALSMYAGPTSLVDVLVDEQKRIAVVEVPAFVQADERRKHFRVERTGRSRATLGFADGRLIRTSVDNISMGGLGVFCQDSVRKEDFYTGLELNADLDLDGAVRFKTTVRVNHVDGLNLGLTFHPELDPLASHDLEQWIHPRRKDAQRLWDNRTELRAEAERVAAAAQASIQPEGTLVLTGDPTLVDAIRPNLEPLGAVRSCLASVGAAKRELAKPPRLVILELPQMDTETRRRTRQMVDALSLSCPLVLMGRGQDPEAGRAFATELKAALYLDWVAEKQLFVSRLLQGFIRRLDEAEAAP